MDAKALAKSKRAHSLHHSRKPHSNKNPKAQFVGSKGSGLLESNWDRYEEELDLDAEDATTKASDIVLPKSKGADFRHLLAEAQSQMHSSSYLDDFLSLDQDQPGNYNQGIGSMLSVRGEGILSWIGHDNFVVEDETALGHEASFLTLNLHALGEQLAKVDISERLFIEADLLLSCDKGSKTSSCQEFDEKGASVSKPAAKTISEELDLGDFCEKEKVVDDNVAVFSSNQGWDILNEVKGDLKSSQVVKSSPRRALESLESFNTRSVVDPHKKLSSFEATAAEAELDMLLDSFTGTTLLDSSGIMSGASTSDKGGPITLSAHTRNDVGSSKTITTAANLGHIRDDLQEETSNWLNHDDLYQHGEMKAGTHKTQSSSSQNAFDDFDSWLDTI